MADVVVEILENVLGQIIRHVNPATTTIEETVARFSTIK